jgi:hypothetical protein
VSKLISIQPAAAAAVALLLHATVGVLTKLDIMDRGTNALPALRNLVVPLRLGYYAIVNRSQADINSNKSMRDARRCGFGEGCTQVRLW